jgi:predicted nucleotidyltransferase
MTIIKKIQKRLTNNTDNLGAAVFGSYARNPNNNHNDIDIIVLIKSNLMRRESITINDTQ